ncbi:zinc-binding alcohol dehydrogenase family protein [Lysobacter sp. Root983]|uniref:zinc-binding alcohol dehydrogenase family protein n=1 Tax=Lysobacter sp. Root983 TaxID=1736613 RepID=UPI0009EAE68B|nr:zinc-binding alcohol dehydrogenase family protein [Lysobacter sp. Root983]
MRAMVLTEIGKPLVMQEFDRVEPGPGELRLRVLACGVCRTDLHVVDGELPHEHTPMVPGHEVVGIVEALGTDTDGLGFKEGDCAGVPWLGGTCGQCRYCREGRENLCDHPEFTGYTRAGGFASHIIARIAYCVPLPVDCDPVTTAPLLCAGLIGWRSLKLAGLCDSLGLYGFGAAGHLVAQIAMQQGRRVYAFTRPGDSTTQSFARSLGVTWAGDSTQPAPVPLDAAIIFASDGALVPLALQAVRKGGTVVCGGIHMSDIPGFPYRLLWEERRLLSVANITRQDAREFSEVLKEHAPTVHATAYPLEHANVAMRDLRESRVEGAAVLCVADLEPTMSNSEVPEALTGSQLRDDMSAPSKEHSQIDPDETRDAECSAGPARARFRLMDSLIRRFGPAAHLVAVLALYALAATAMGLAIAMALWFLDAWQARMVPLSGAWHWILLGFGYGLAFFLAGFTLLVVVPIYNFLLPTRMGPYRGGYFTIASLPWCVHNGLFYLVRYSFLPFVTLTPFGPWFLRAMGMRIGRRAFINTELISDPCLISIGDDTVIGGAVHLFAHFGGGGHLTIAPVSIGARATIGQGATVMGDVEVGADATILPHSVLLPGSRVAAGETWGGVPARALSKRALSRLRAAREGKI